MHSTIPDFDKPTQQFSGLLVNGLSLVVDCDFLERSAYQDEKIIPAAFFGFDAETESPISQNLTEFRPNIGLERLFCGAAYWLRPTGLTRLSELPLQFVTI